VKFEIKIRSTQIIILRHWRKVSMFKTINFLGKAGKVSKRKMKGLCSKHLRCVSFADIACCFFLRSLLSLSPCLLLFLYCCFSYCMCFLIFWSRLKISGLCCFSAWRFVYNVVWWLVLKFFMDFPDIWRLIPSTSKAIYFVYYRRQIWVNGSSKLVTLLERLMPYIHDKYLPI